MNVFKSVHDVKHYTESVISIGTFDGVHNAHRKIIEKVLTLSDENKSRSFLVTFDPHPQEILKSKTPDIQLLTTTEEKLRIFELLGIENVLVINFTKEFSNTSAKDFYRGIIFAKIGIKHLVVGYDHLFGRNREGDFSTLKQISEVLGFENHRVAEIDIDGLPVSSSRIRKHLLEGDIESANRLLGYEYGLEGKVTQGDKVGQQLGYPTANILPSKANKVFPKDGVYVIRIQHENKSYFGMMNIGVRPTLTEGKKRIAEANIFNFDKNVYGETLRVSFITKLRNEVKFSCKEELISQINNDRDNTFKYINENKL